MTSNIQMQCVSTWRTVNPKLRLKVNSLWIEIKAQNFVSQVLSKHTFKIRRKKKDDFLDHGSTLNGNKIRVLFYLPISTSLYWGTAVVSTSTFLW